VPDIVADRVFGMGVRVCACSHVFEGILYAYTQSLKDRHSEMIRANMHMPVCVRARERA
jgi:hypothetical protein